MNRRLPLVAALVLAACAPPAPAPAPRRASPGDPARARPPPLAALPPPLRARAQSATLANGLHVIVAPTDDRRVRVTMVLRHGVATPADEAANLGSLALGAFAQHLIALPLQAPAGRAEAESCGYSVMWDRAEVHLVVAPGGLGASLWAVASALRHPAPSIEALRTQRDVWVREVTRTPPDERADKARAAHALRRAGLPHEPAFASTDEVHAVPAGAIARWLDAHLTPDAVALLVQGPVAPPEVMAYVDRLFATWRVPAASARVGASPSPAEPATVTLVATRPRALVEARVALTLPVQNAPERAAAEVFAHLWCADHAGTVLHALREASGEAYATQVTTLREGAVTTVLCDARVRAPDAAHAVTVMRDAAAALVAGRFDPTDFDDARRQLRAANDFMLESPAKRSEMLLLAAIDGIAPERESPSVDALTSLTFDVVRAFVARAVRVDHAQAIVFGPLDALPDARFVSIGAGAVHRVPAGS